MVLVLKTSDVKASVGSNPTLYQMNFFTEVINSMPDITLISYRMRITTVDGAQHFSPSTEYVEAGRFEAVVKEQIKGYVQDGFVFIKKANESYAIPMSAITQIAHTVIQCQDYIYKDVDDITMNMRPKLRWSPETIKLYLDRVEGDTPCFDEIEN